MIIDVKNCVGLLKNMQKTNGYGYYTPKGTIAIVQDICNILGYEIQGLGNAINIKTNTNLSIGAFKGKFSDADLNVIKEVKILIDGKDTGIIGYYTLNGTYAYISSICSALKINFEGLGKTFNIGGAITPSTPVLPLKGLRIALDPGHGGTSDNQSPANRNYKEDEFVLKTSLDAKAKLISLGADVRLTRETDVNPSLQERGDMVRDWNPHIVISVHTNAAGNVSQTGAKGTVVLYSIKHPNDKAIANKFIEIISNILGTVKRSAYTKESENTKYTDWYGILRSNTDADTHPFIFEAFFHDNPNEVNKFINGGHILYANAIVECAKYYWNLIK